MLAQGRKKSYIKAVCKALDIRPGRIKVDSADALFFILLYLLPDFGRGARGYKTAHMREDYGGHSFI